jgi:hypothetical protein
MWFPAIRVIARSAVTKQPVRRFSTGLLRFASNDADGRNKRGNDRE